MVERRYAGAASELAVCADLLEQGHEVFRAVSSHASCDLIAIMDGELKRIEVRTVAERKDGSLSVSTKDTDECDLYAFVSAKRNRIEYETPREANSRIKVRRGARWADQPHQMTIYDCIADAEAAA